MSGQSTEIVRLTDDERTALRQAFLGEGRSSVAYALAEGRTERVAEIVERIVADRLAPVAAARDACREEDRRLRERVGRTQNKETQALLWRERNGWSGAAGLIDDALRTTPSPPAQRGGAA